MYRIKNWDKHFETSESRKLKKLTWLRIPTNQDSLEYRLIASRKDGAEIFCAWILMLEVASKQSPRGDLPFSPEELGIITGFPAGIFSAALDFLISPKIAWIEQSPGTSGENPEVSVDAPETARIEEIRGDKIRGDKSIIGTSANASLPKKKPRKRNPLFDEIHRVFFQNATLSKSDGSRIGRLAQELKERGADPSEIERRAQIYVKLYPGMATTPEAVMKHWYDLTPENLQLTTERLENDKRQRQPRTFQESDDENRAAALKRDQEIIERWRRRRNGNENLPDSNRTQIPVAGPREGPVRREGSGPGGGV